MKKIVPHFERCLFSAGYFFLIISSIEMWKETQFAEQSHITEIIRSNVLSFLIFGIITAGVFLHHIEYDENADYICFSDFGQKFEAKLSDITYIGYIPFCRGIYRIKIKAKTKRKFPTFCIGNKNKLKELYKTVKNYNPECSCSL